MLVKFLLVAHIAVLGNRLGPEFVINSTCRQVSWSSGCCGCSSPRSWRSACCGPRCVPARP
ncbi:MAG: hypothetical protein MUC71_00135 [Steroidobacteraceae bacterium]|nr:hypothetical protein [Steroidobacteraceae bacterium]